MRIENPVLLMRDSSIRRYNGVYDITYTERWYVLQGEPDKNIGVETIHESKVGYFITEEELCLYEYINGVWCCGKKR